MRYLFSFSILTSVCAISAQTYASCGSAFCMLNTNWSAQGVWTQPGARIDLRYEYVDQDEVRSGTGSASADEIAHMHHREVSTLNNNIQATFDYTFNDTYGITINAPFVSREHEHLHVSHANPNDIEVEQWDFKKLGDVRVLGRMQLSDVTDMHQAYGVIAGLKLPTGDFDVANGEGEVAERSLQPGTGTTDVIFGGYYRKLLPEIKSQWFTQLSFQKALNKRDEFESGQQIAWDLGYRYNASDMVNLAVQLNYVDKSRDSGNEAEPEDSGSKTLAISPGVSISFNKTMQLYAFVHHRLYQDVNGVQLSSKDSVVAGFSTRF